MKLEVYTADSLIAEDRRAALLRRGTVPPVCVRTPVRGAGERVTSVGRRAEGMHSCVRATVLCSVRVFVRALCVGTCVCVCVCVWEGLQEY